MAKLPKWSPPLDQIVRQPGWETRLSAKLVKLTNEPFAWGVSDCLTQQADICHAMTGVQFLPRQFRTYRSSQGALKALLKNDLTSVQDLLDRVFERVPVALARRGDCGLVSYPALGDQVEVTATIFGHFAIARSELGPVRVPALQITKAWRIG